MSQRNHRRVLSDRPANHARDLRRRGPGFTLVEVMVVVALLGVLAAAAVPKYVKYIYRSKRTEAIYGLRAIHDHQTAYYGREMEYSDSFEEIGAPLDHGFIREDGAFQSDLYVFTLDTWNLGDRPNANYRATATANLDPNDDTLDIVIIENRVTIED